MIQSEQELLGKFFLVFVTVELLIQFTDDLFLCFSLSTSLHSAVDFSSWGSSVQLFSNHNSLISSQVRKVISVSESYFISPPPSLSPSLSSLSLSPLPLLPPEPPSPTAARPLQLVAKCTLNIANLVEFKVKEKFMTALNSLVQRHRQQMVEFIDQISVSKV